MEVETTFCRVHVRQQQRVAAIIGLFVLLVCQGGCARTRTGMSSLWNKVPPVRWANRESSKDSAKAQGLATAAPRPAEPAVAANVALKKEDEAELSGIAPSVDGTSKSASEPFGLRLSPPEPRTDQVDPGLEFDAMAETSFPVETEKERLNSPLERLNAAMVDDVRRALASSQRSEAMQQARSRVDSLISRARELLEMGELEEARDAARAAQEIGDVAQLEYSPDEDRPTDLVRRIAGDLEASRLTQESGPEEESSADAAPPREAELSPPLAKKLPGTPGINSGIPSRTPRSWATLFRREKKPNATSPPDPVTQTSSNTMLRLPKDVSHRSSANVPDLHPDLHDAIVVANRSVSLGAPETAAESDNSVGRVNEFIESDQDSSNARIAVPTESEGNDVEAEREASDLGSADPPSQTLGSEEGSRVPVEPRKVEIAPRAATCIATIDDDLLTDETDEPKTCRRFNWIYVSTAIGICSLIAVACYRRRPT